jgi:hypothetical protein
MSSRVARWYIFKQKNPNFGGPIDELPAFGIFNDHLVI